MATSGISSDREKDPRPHLKFEHTTVHEIKTSEFTHKKNKNKLQVILNSNAMYTSASNPPIEQTSLYGSYKLL